MSFKLDEKQLQGILAEVEADLVPYLKSEKEKLEKLAKAHDESAPPEDSKPEAKEDSAGPASAFAPPESSASASPAAAVSAAPEDAPPPPPPSPEPPAPPAGDGSLPPGAALPTDPAALQALCEQLPLEQLKAVYLAAKQSLFAKMQPAAGPEASAPPPTPEATPALKGELKASPGNGGKVLKSEPSPEVELLKAELKAQTEKMDALARAVTLLAGTPIRKAITGISVISKAEAKDEARLSRDEINSKLREHARNPKLAKKDREAINRFYDAGCTNVEGVKHLLQEQNP